MVGITPFFSPLLRGLQEVFASSLWLHTKSVLAANPEVNVVAFKMRSWVIDRGDLLRAAAPQAKTMFLYRNAVDVVDSFCMAFYNSGANKLFRWIKLDTLYGEVAPSHLTCLQATSNLGRGRGANDGSKTNVRGYRGRK